MFSQLFVLTTRGDTLVFRDYCGDIKQRCTEIFYNELKHAKDGRSPCFNIDGVSYIFIYIADLYFVATTKKNISSTCALEFLQRFASICKDYCGVLNENAIQQNFVLIYEILDEVLHFGNIQETSSQALKPFIQNEPVIVEPYDKPQTLYGGAVFGLEKLSIGSDAANKPLGHWSRFAKPEKGEIFSEILEQLVVLIDSEGNVLHSEIIGRILVRSFLPEGSVLGITLNEELYQLRVPNGFGAQLDDYNFHPSVNSAEFDSNGTLSVMPVVGEFSLMNYRMSGNIAKDRLPFSVHLTIEESVLSKILDISVRIHCNVPPDKFAHKMIVEFPVPKTTESVSCTGQIIEFCKPKNLVIWKFANFQGGTVINALFKLNGSFGDSSVYKREVDSISLRFEIPLLVCSGAKVKSLRVTGGVDKLNKSIKWTRLITYSDSYVIRL